LKKKLKTPTKKTTKIVQKLVPVEVCVEKNDVNPFPKLMPKNTQNEKIKTKPKEKAHPKVKQKEKVQTIKASTFRLKTDSKIYNAQGGKKIDEWEKDRSFTSNKKKKKLG